jgi:acetyltransferase-like isoleucine patch superfamily enzyme
MKDLLRIPAVQLHWRRRHVKIALSAVIRMDPGAILEIGEGTTIGMYTILDLLNDPLAREPVPARLKIGRMVAINEFNNIRASGGTVEIGDGCLISQYVSILARNHSIEPGQWIRNQPWDTRKRDVVIEEDVWVGAHAVILPGVRIGRGSVIGAGAIVTHDIPENAIALGAPATVAGYRGKGINRRNVEAVDVRA